MIFNAGWVHAQQQGASGGQSLLQPATTAAGATGATGAADAAGAVGVTGPIRLRNGQPDRSSANMPAGAGAGQRRGAAAAREGVDDLDDFEAYVSRQAGPSAVVRRFGAELVTGGSLDDGGEDAQPLVPADYVVSPGDELQLLLWGSVDADLRLTVDRTGRIAIPRVGAVMVAGQRYAELEDVISKRVRTVFRNYQLSVSLGRLRNVRVFVTGYVRRPGAYSVSALSTLVAAVMRAGGPAASGSFRDIQLRRGREQPQSVDLYDLMLRGDKSADRTLQADDIIYVGPVGPQVALIGSVNKPAVFEIKPAETLNDVLTMAGGFTAIADRSRLTLERLDDRQLARVNQLAWPAQSGMAPASGDLIRAFSAVDAILPVALQNKRIRVEGEVRRPGDFVVPANTNVAAVLELAGGVTANAFIFGTEFSRESVRQSQQINYDRALRDMETEFVKSTGTQRVLDAQEAAAQTAQIAATNRLIERLKAVKPNGRIIFQIEPWSTDLPDLPLEDGDRLYIPARPTTIGVFGSVFSSGSFLMDAGRNVGDFLSMAGGPTRGADTSSTFVLRANGTVVSQPQKSGFLGWQSSSLQTIATQAGDTIFVPEETNKTTWVQNLKEWTQIFYQFGLGAAAIRTFAN